MKNTNLIFLGFLLALHANAALADSDVDIPQVTNNSSLSQNKENESSIKVDTNSAGGKKDYQKQILSNPAISNIARANSLTKGGGNTAVIMQNGHSNHSSVKQSGSDNYAKQTQAGKANDIYLDQQGKHNRSEEKQDGNYNHKVKIQNGIQEETTEIKQ